MHVRSRFFFIGLLLCSASAGAQAPAGPRRLTWDDGVALALRHSPDLAAAARAVEAAQDAYYGSFNGFMPQLSLTHTYSDSSSGSPAWAAQGNLSLNLWSLGQVASIKAAAASLALAKANLALTSANLRFSLREAFTQALFSEEDIEVSRRILDLRERDAKLVTLRYDSGRESKGNMLRAKAQVLQAQADLSQAQRGLDSARIALDRQMGLDDFTAVAATGALSAAPPPDGLPGDLGAVVAARPDVAVQDAQVQGAAASLTQSRAVLSPSLTADYSRGVVGASEFPSDRSQWTFLGTLSYPLFGGGPTAAYYGVRSARRNLDRAQENLRAAREQAVADLHASLAAFADASDQVRVESALLEAARQRNDEADVRYESGLLTYDNWEIIASDRINTERQAIGSRLNAAQAEAGWARALGRGLKE